MIGVWRQWGPCHGELHVCRTDSSKSSLHTTSSTFWRPRLFKNTVLKQSCFLSINGTQREALLSFYYYKFRSLFIQLLPCCVAFPLYTMVIFIPLNFRTLSQFQIYHGLIAEKLLRVAKGNLDYWKNLGLIKAMNNFIDGTSFFFSMKCL